jgi:UDP-N-acetylmuramoylalanine--D-glutamate ligase
MFPATSFKGKRVAIFGLARSGISSAKALIAGGAHVFAWDDSDASQAVARDEGLPVTNIHALDFKSIDALVLSPGVPLTHPEPHWTVLKAAAAGIEVIGDTEVFARELEGHGAKLVAITGTNGKSTTTALVGHVLAMGGLDVQVGGNIGNAVFNLSPPVKGRVYVLELSSFQIDLMPSLAPDVGILTNISPDHLDRHGTIENYAAVKGRMFARQAEGQTAVISVDDEWSSQIAATIPVHVRQRRVSVLNELQDGISVTNGILIDRKNGSVEAEMDLRTMKSLRGRHNWQNAAMAYAAARSLALSTAAVQSAMIAFPGLAHRMQEIATVGSVSFVNDSKATNADAAEKALSSFETIFWIAGGISKSGGIVSLRPLFGNIRKAYLIGVAADEFARVLDGKVAYETLGTLEAAVAAAHRDALMNNEPNPVVLLSPACASFDQYKNFEVRGDAFVKAVSQLPEVTMKVKAGIS